MSGAKYSVLVVDDDPPVVDSVAAYLSREAQRNRDAVEVLRAFSVSEALLTLAKRPVDVIFSDYRFPDGMSGDELIDRIDDPFGNKLIILMSAWDQKVLEGVITKRHKKLGARFKFLRKPFEGLEIQAKYLEIEQFFSSRPYPYPLVHASRVLEASATGLAQIMAMKDVVESLAKYCVAIIMSDLERLNAVGGLRLTIRPHQDLTLGAWLKWLEQALRYYRLSREHAHMPELIDLFEVGDGRGLGPHLRTLYEFKKYRDEEVAHGFTADDGSYAAAAGEYAARLKPLLNGLRFMTRHTLFASEGSDFTGDAARPYAYDVRVLMGAEMVFDRQRLQSPTQLQRGQVYSYGPDGSCLSLSPYFSYQMCNPCRARRFFMLDSIRPTQLEYKAFCNHRHADQKVVGSFNRLLHSPQPAQP